MMTDFDETIKYLFRRLPMYQKIGKSAYKDNIGNIVNAVKILKKPHKKFQSIHIAGTNGKGSTSHMIASIMYEANYKVGLYTSPHLKDFRERIKINGEMISKDYITKFISKHKFEFEKINMSFFEMTVALAFNYFAEKKVDIAIIETGLGGRLDSTNIINPILSIITNISHDHNNLLGDTIEEIAKEKSGIIKEKTPVILGRKQQDCLHVFLQKARKLKSKIYFTNNDIKYVSDLTGNYQKENIATAVQATWILNEKGYKISDFNIKTGLLNTISNTSILGRWQILSKIPIIITDTAHNLDGIRHNVEQLKDLGIKELHIVFGIVKEKKIDEILKILPKKAKYYFCEAKNSRSLPKEVLFKQALKHGLKGNIYNSVSNALNAAKENADKKDCIFIGGSTFVVAEVI
tara:strand:- start:103 stop:1320 length:1218 start_codon:yes stop_codon:yes gene_type:complete